MKGIILWPWLKISSTSTVISITAEYSVLPSVAPTLETESACPLRIDYVGAQPEFKLMKAVQSVGALLELKMITLINNDFREIFLTFGRMRMVFADPPDNISLGYGEYDDCLSKEAYYSFLLDILILGTARADVVWISYNAAHTHLMGHLIYHFLENSPEWEAKPCVQVFTFGQYNQCDLGNNHRPLARLIRKETTLYPDAIRIPSWRQLHGDKRADPRGKVPGDVFDLPRVTGNSKQRRCWHPTQLNELLYERCIRLTCKPTDTVCDLFAGTGTMARVCAETGNPCILIDVDAGYCKKIAEEHELISVSKQEWRSE